MASSHVVITYATCDEWRLCLHCATFTVAGLVSAPDWVWSEDVIPPATVNGSTHAGDHHLTVTAAPEDSVYTARPYIDHQAFVRGAPMQRQISIREAMDLPGVLGDPIKAVSTLPGVVTAAGGELFFNGSKDGESSPTINHLPVGHLFHLDGLDSVMSPEAVEQLDV